MKTWHLQRPAVFCMIAVAGLGVLGTADDKALGQLICNNSHQLDCSEIALFSTLNSNLNGFLSYDDLFATETGTIEQIRFWGTGYLPPPLGGTDFANFDSFQINFYEWIEDGVCGFLPGELLSSNTVPLSAVDPQIVCDGPQLGVMYRSVLATLAEPFVVLAGERYVLRIAAHLTDEGGPWFGWASWGGAGAISIDDSNPCFVAGPALAFELLPCEAPACPWDCVGNDGIIGIDEFLAVIGLWGTGHVNEPCDFDGDGEIGINEFLKIIGTHGVCP